MNNRLKRTFRKPLLYYISNVIISVSLCGIFLTLFPVIALYVLPPRIKHSVHSSGYFITIPKINAQTAVIDDVNPWNESEYLSALKHGIAHARNTAAPGQPGMAYYFAHSSGPPWDDTFFNTVFLRLGELKPGDIIYITKNGHVYIYAVTKSKEVWPNDVNAVLAQKKTEIILQTCTPIGTSLKRLLVFATPKV